MSTQSAETPDFSVGLSHKFIQAFVSMGGTPKDLNDLREDSEKMRKIVGMARNFCDADSLKTLVNLSDDPYLPHERWRKIAHKDEGQADVTFEDGQLFVGQRRVMLSEKNPLNEDFPDYDHLNGCMLRFLLDHPEFHPPRWEGKYISFWGTHYQSPRGVEAILCLHKEKGFHEWDWIKPGSSPEENPAAVI